MTEWVGQEHAHGCGPAVLSMLTGRSYADVAARFAWHDFTREGLASREMDSFLAECGFAVSRRYEYTPRVSGEPWPPHPFARAHYCHVVGAAGAACCHWVVLVGDGVVLDPLTPERRHLTDYPAVYSVTAVVSLE